VARDRVTEAATAVGTMVTEDTITTAAVTVVTEITITAEYQLSYFFEVNKKLLNKIIHLDTSIKYIRAYTYARVSLQIITSTLLSLQSFFKYGTLDIYLDSNNGASSDLLIRVVI